jgi:hypothetical protein
VLVSAITLTPKVRFDLAATVRGLLCHSNDWTGSAIPFGRSLTYRFACGGFFAALAVAEVDDLPEPLAHPGALRGFLSRHMRWWAKHSKDMFYTDGTLSVGWLYPNLHMAEDYNSPQSPYWCMKTLIAVALTSDNPFWAAQETAYPDSLPATITLRPPGHIICNHPQGNHHFLLSTRQFVAWPLKANKAKYSKFAYSSAFAFSVPVGEDVMQLALDNTLALSRDGRKTWAVKWKWAREPTFSTAKVFAHKRPGENGIGSVEEVPISTVTWWPWDDLSVEVETTLVAPSSRWPDWHVRVHRIRAAGPSSKSTSLNTLEGGFAVSGCHSKTGRYLQALSGSLREAQQGKSEGIVHSANSTLILTTSGTSGIASSSLEQSTSTPSDLSSSAFRPSPNTNIARPRTLIPVVERSFNLESNNSKDIWLVTCVFAAASDGEIGENHLEQAWLDVPTVVREGKMGEVDAIGLP